MVPWLHSPRVRANSPLSRGNNRAFSERRIHCELRNAIASSRNSSIPTSASRTQDEPSKDLHGGPSGGRWTASHPKSFPRTRRARNNDLVLKLSFKSISSNHTKKDNKKQERRSQKRTANDNNFSVERKTLRTASEEWYSKLRVIDGNNRDVRPSILGSDWKISQRRYQVVNDDRDDKLGILRRDRDRELQKFNTEYHWTQCFKKQQSLNKFM